MKFKFQFKKKAKQGAPQGSELEKAMLKYVGGASRGFTLYEGEQIVPAMAESMDRDVCFQMVSTWRPEGQPLPDGVEVIPGYVRPPNWREIEAASDKLPGGIEFDGKYWSAE